MPRNGIKASVYMQMRNDLIDTVKSIDAEIKTVLAFPASKRAAGTARELFAWRKRVAEELRLYGVEVDDHPALKKGT